MTEAGNTYQLEPEKDEMYVCLYPVSSLAKCARSLKAQSPKNSKTPPTMPRPAQR